ncbi:rRNA small subunit methyltransferase B [Cellulomonas sp. zg-ZUI222]|uniref:RsmB/NOP family class I SAM-dependent RNA methyltransferase n=1 Tax=Cellulomonas TaxID=1707 RepID=UPI001A94A70A|nr:MULTISPECIES: transcription antitermination factor NusB [Cellulomonas]MBO0900344.1 rRNA small subunit methyltransferase B [Cellulomonas sp. zg-ZUI22]MBO0920742.1 rRNA small subunit methyltransferase B [Cellulomonas wangleii]
MTREDRPRRDDRAGRDDRPRRDGSGQDARRDARGRQRGEARVQGRAGRTTAAPSQRTRQGDAARGAAYDTLRAVADSDAYANLVLPPLLRERRIAGRDAAFATELAYGTLRLRGRYDAVLEQASSRPLAQVDPPVLDVLRMGAHQLLGMRVPPHAAVSETVGLARERVGAGAAQFVNAVLRRVAEQPLDVWLTRVADAADPTGDDVVARLAAVESHPAWVVRALRESLVGSGRSADELAALLEADNASPRVTLVARPGLVTPAGLAEQVDAVPAGLAPTALVLTGGDPGAVPAVRDGLAGVQDEGSQLVTLAFAAAPVEGRDERWLDLCAGPGGKAALLGALAAERGARLVANEVQPHRARLVEQALRAVPHDAVEEVRTGDGRTVGELEPGSYDRVLLDAPCTGLGALRRRPESRWRRTPADLATLGALQRALLASALAAVRPGGVVAYVTCSPHLAETQLVVLDGLRAAARAGTPAEVVDAAPVLAGVAPAWEPVPGRTDVQLWPHVHGTDAMHLTLLRRL